MWYFISPDLSNDCNYATYLDYFNSLEKMTDIIIQQYLNNNDWFKAYFIGFALKIFFFQSYTSLKNVEELKTILLASKGGTVRLEGIYPGYEGSYAYPLNLKEE